MSVGKLLEKTVFKLLKSNLELVLLLNKLGFLCCKIRSLLCNDKSKQLIFETLFSDSEVNQCAFGLDLRWIVRVGQFGVEVEHELWIKC